MAIVIKATGISKKYLIRHQDQTRYLTLRESLAGVVRKPGRMLSGKVRSSGNGSTVTEEFWALRDIDFSIDQGDRVGIIGRNGAGKSTLLKILSRITEPSEGRLAIAGRVASLLEVGTGFHPELTGRENIFLNGAILGMSRQDIRRKFDEIVEFAEVERFLDTPVKRYSSGMYMRLAFSIAAHLEPDILVVDEVLAVGDSAFQKKCLGRMEDVGKEGRTILFVSHNMATIQHLCNSCIYLENGQIRRTGPAKEVIDEYLTCNESVISETKLDDRIDRKGAGDIIFQSITFSNGCGQKVSSFKCGETAVFSLDIFNKNSSTKKNVIIGFGIDNSAGERIAQLSNDINGQSLETIPGSSSILVTVPKMPLLPGKYFFTLFLSANGEIKDWVKRAGMFSVDESNFYGTGKLPASTQGYFLLDYKFG